MENSPCSAAIGDIQMETTGFSRTLDNVIVREEILEDAKTVTVVGRYLYRQKGSGQNLEPIGCFMCYVNKKDGGFVCVPIECPKQPPSKPTS